METLFQFISEYGSRIFDFVVYILGIVFFIITFKRTGNFKKSLQSLKEYDDMIKYHTAATRAALEEKTPTQQSFTETVKDYILDPSTNELQESPIEKNVQDYIDSHIDIALDRALQKFCPPDVVDEDDVIADYTNSREDLAVIAEAMDVAEEYRERFGLSDKLSISQIYAEVNKRSEDLKAKLYKTNKKEQNENVESKKEETEQKI